MAKKTTILDNLLKEEQILIEKSKKASAAFEKAQQAYRTSLADLEKIRAAIAGVKGISSIREVVETKEDPAKLPAPKEPTPIFSSSIRR